MALTTLRVHVTILEAEEGLYPITGAYQVVTEYSLSCLSGFIPTIAV